jgi:hypothetical protein
MRFGILAATIRLLQNLEPPTSRIAWTAGMQIVVGVLEASTIGLLVPLLSLLTGSESKASGALLATLFRVTGPIERTTALVVLAALILGVIATKNIMLYVAARYAAETSFCIASSTLLLTCSSATPPVKSAQRCCPRRRV